MLYYAILCSSVFIYLLVSLFSHIYNVVTCSFVGCFNIYAVSRQRSVEDSAIVSANGLETRMTEKTSALNVLRKKSSIKTLFEQF